jgi:hypothetical protein
LNLTFTVTVFFCCETVHREKFDTEQYWSAAPGGHTVTVAAPAMTGMRIASEKPARAATSVIRFLYKDPS